MSGSKKQDEFYHIEVKSQQEFKRFRTQIVGQISGIERVGGQHEDGSWETVKWLVSKEMAHIENGILVADQTEVKELFEMLGAAPNTSSIIVSQRKLNLDLVIR